MSRPKYTKAEMDAARRDAAWLVNDTDTDARFKARALAGPCHCMGAFVCTRCKLESKSLEKFLAVAPAIDDFREEAARVCEETARYERGERPALRLDPNDIANNEFTDSAAGIAAEVATTVSAALKSARLAMLVSPDQVWDLAATMLRGGWQRGHRLHPMVTRGEPS